MKYLITLIIALSGIHASAQDIDEGRMTRDIQIAEDIINGLIEQESKTNRLFKSIDVTGNYIQDYGVIFNIPVKGGIWPLGLNVWEGESGEFVISDKVKEKDDKNGKQHLSYAYSGEEFEELQESRDDYLQEVMETFLVDYADLIGQLKPTDKIMLKSEQKRGGVFVIGGGDQRYRFNFRSGGGSNDDEDESGEENVNEEDCCEEASGNYVLSSEVKKSDLTAYKSGKIDRDQLVSRILMEKTESVSGREPELELLATIFQRLYKSDLSETYFATRAPEYDRIIKFGVIYNWRVYSSNIDNDRHNMPTVDLYNLSPEERNRKVEELYPKFKEQFIGNMVEYGRTLKGLQGDDILMFKIKLTQCENCSIPKSIELSVKRSVLDDYEKQRIDLAAAKSKVAVKELREK